MEVSRIKNGKKKARIVDEDQISKLPDDVIHQILSYLDARLAVQTSVLSKRWKLVWTALPFLNFNHYDMHYKEELRNFIYCKLMNHVFTRRNHKSRILKLDMCRTQGLHLRQLKKYIKYAVSHEVQSLTVESDRYCSLSLFSSKTLRELKLAMQFESDDVMKADCWSLPNLTTLLLKSNESYFRRSFKVPESCWSLPALKTLDLKDCKLPELFSLPMLTTLCLERCSLRKKVWDLPALLSLQLSDVVFPQNMSDYFLALASLRNLDIDFDHQYIRHFVISSFHLVNLRIKVRLWSMNELEHKIVVLAPKLCNFETIGFYRMVFEGSELENAIIRSWDRPFSSAVFREYRHLIKNMFSQLGSAKILSLDLVTIQVLSQNPDIVAHWHCPFYNLKYLKLLHGCEESSLSSAVRNYLLSGSPGATIVKPVPQDNVIAPMMPAVSLSAQNAVQEKASETPSKELVDTNKSTGKGQQIKAPVAVAGNVQATSAGDNSCLVLWQGHKVNSEFVGLLDQIMKSFPETFRQLPTKNKKIWTMKLNTLCSLVNAFTKTPKVEVNTEVLSEYRALFTDLQGWGFKLNWLINHLNYIEQLLFSKPMLHELHAIDSRINDAKSRLQDLQTLRVERMTHSESSPTRGTSLAATAGYLGDGLL